MNEQTLYEDRVPHEHVAAMLEHPDLSGSMLIAIERARQVRVKGYTVPHDANYTDGFLSQYAAYLCVAESSGVDYPKLLADDFSENLAATREGGDEPTMRDIIRAGALLAAEIDRRMAAMSKEELAEFKKTVKW